MRPAPDQGEVRAHSRRGQGTQVVHGLEQVRLPLRVGPHHHGEPRRHLQPDVTVAAEVPDLDPEQAHRALWNPYPTGAGNRTGMARYTNDSCSPRMTAGFRPSLISTR